MTNIILIALLTLLDTNGCILGTVLDSNENISDIQLMVISGAEVQLLGSATLEVEKQTFTDKTGAFHFENVIPGSYFVSIKMGGFREHVAAVSLKSGEEINIGKQFLKLVPLSEELHTVDENGRSLSLERWQKDFARFDHIRHVNGTLVMTVCEFMKEKSALSTSRYSYYIVIIGTLMQTPQGRWLQQTCNEQLKSGDFAWPTAVSLQGESKEWASDVLNFVSRPPDDEIDPRDRDRTWAAAYGLLDNRESLVAAPCGDNGKLCGYGFGPISAPAQLTTHQQIRIFR